MTPDEPSEYYYVNEDGTREMRVDCFDCWECDVGHYIYMYEENEVAMEEDLSFYYHQCSECGHSEYFSKRYPYKLEETK